MEGYILPDELNEERKGMRNREPPCVCKEMIFMIDYWM